MSDVAARRVRQTFKAKELPPRLREALRAGPDVDVVVVAEVLAVSQQEYEPSLTELIGSGSGGFTSRSEADRYIERLRDEWSS